MSKKRKGRRERSFWLRSLSHERREKEEGKRVDVRMGKMGFEGEEEERKELL